MNRGEHAVAARRALEEQLSLLAGLRNAQSRDPSFKSWRQNALTVIQRIWPADRDRGERFRRIPFTAPGGKSDPRAVRESFTRGCGEAAALLRRLLDEVDRDGVPEPEVEVRGETPVLGDSEEAFPTLDLAAPAATSGAALPEIAEHMVDLGGPRPTHDTVTASLADRRPEDPLPPTLKVEVPDTPPAHAPGLRADAVTPADPARTPEPARATAPPPAPEESPSRAAARRAARPSRAMKRPNARLRLKDMLGFSDTPPAPAAATPAPSPPPAESVPPAAAPPPRRRNRTPVDIGSLIAEEFRNAPAIGPFGASTPPAEAAVPPPPAAAPAPAAAATPSPAAEDAALDADAFAAATRDFLETSPVLGSVGRPVQRGTDATRFLEPDAVAVATLATELARLGVPEPARDPLQAQLSALARALESGAPEWSALRAAVQAAMEHPELARRLMPVVLPWLDRAA